MSRLRAFLLGVLEYRSDCTTHCEHATAYDRGRDLAHRLTLRRFDR